MNPVYLDSIVLDNFRGFGVNQTMHFTGEPGVIILSGANGLGKSTVIESIEWAITGDILRLQNISDGNFDQAALLRIDPLAQKGPREFGVRLDFTDNMGVYGLERRFSVQNGSAKEVMLPSFDDIQRILTNPDWRISPDSIGTYLHLTHVQSQSSSTRFSGLKPKEKWEKLRGPAGLALLSLAQERLANVTRAFNEELAKRSNELTLARNTEEGLNKLLESRQHLKNNMSLDNALSPSEVVEELNSLIIDQSNVSRKTEITLEEAKTILGRKSAEVESNILNSSQRIRALESVRDIPKKDRDTEEEIKNNANKKREIDVVVREKNDGFKTSNKKLMDFKNLKSTTGSVKTDLERKLFIIFQFQNASNDVGVLERAIVERNEQISAASARESVLAVQFQEKEKLFKEIKTATIEITNANALKTELEDLKEKVALHLSSRAVIEESAVREESLKKEIVDKNSIISVLDKEIDGLQKELLVASNIVADARSRFGDLERAVTSVFSHLNHTSTTCPVCLTVFMDGELMRKSEEAVTAIASTLPPLERRFSELKSKMEDFKSKRMLEGNSLSILIKEKDQIELGRRKNKFEEAELLKHPILTGQSLETANQSIDTRLSEISLIIDAQMQALSKFPNEQVVSNEINSIRSSIEALRKEKSFLINQIDNSKSKLDFAKSFLSKEKLNLQSVVETVENLNVEEEKLREQLRKTETDLLMYISQEAEQEKLSLILRNELNELHEKLSFLDRENERLSKLKEALKKIWEEAGLTGEPSELTIDREVSEIKKSSLRLEGILEKISILKGKLSAFIENSELKRLEDSITKAVKAENVADEGQLHIKKRELVLNAQISLERCTSVKEGVDWLKEKLSEETEKYAKDVLDPLNNLQEKFLVALTSSRRWKVKNLTKTTQKRTEVSLKLVPKGNADVDEESHNANEILSEGQMAAVTLAQLFSMSVAYGWSRWKSLLLDAPTQHNDLIHVAAFVEVIRNLVLSKKYQVVICTHDIEESDFIKRKLKASKINVIEHRFESHSVSGVKTSML